MRATFNGVMNWAISLNAGLLAMIYAISFVFSSLVLVPNGLLLIHWLIGVTFQLIFVARCLRWGRVSGWGKVAAVFWMLMIVVNTQSLFAAYGIR